MKEPGTVNKSVNSSLRWLLCTQNKRNKEPSLTGKHTMVGIQVGFILSFLALLAVAAGDDDLIIPTANGRVRGVRLPVPGGSKFISAFMGIPYAKPPVGKLRFRHPEPPEAWRGVRNTTRFSSSCHQAVDTFYPGFPGAEMWNPNTRLDEDCLYLNVWTPSLGRQGSTLPLDPVMVWIYGGGFSSGTSSLAVYDGRLLSQSERVVVVSMNYRVGALGFLSLPGSEVVRGNVGLFDQRLALQWVADNIVAFGGDPSSVTLFGESAGAASVGLHLLSPGSHALFSRAILQSGTPNALWAANEPAQAWNYSLSLAQHLHCPHGPAAEDVLACLQTVAPEKIINHQYNVLSLAGGSPFLPTVDGDFLLDVPEVLIQAGRFQKTDILLGLNQDEGTYFLMYNTPGFALYHESLIGQEQFQQNVAYKLPGLSEMALEAVVFHYTDWRDEQNGRKNRDALGQLVGDRLFCCPLLEFARQYTRHQGRARLFQFQHRSSANPWPRWMGVMHADEIEFVFGLPLNGTRRYSDEDKAVSRRIMKHWANFARTGDPSIEGFDWPVFSMERQEYVTLSSDPPQVLQKLKAQQCKFWDSFLPKLQAFTVSIDELELQWRSQFHRWLSYMLDWKNQLSDWSSGSLQRCESP